MCINIPNNTLTIILPQPHAAMHTHKIGSGNGLLPDATKLHYLNYLHMMTSSNGNIFRTIGLCAGNSTVTGEFSAQRLETRSFDVFFDLCLNKPLSKHRWGWWFETLSRPLWRHFNEQCWNSQCTCGVACSILYFYFAYIDISIASRESNGNLYKISSLNIERPDSWSLCRKVLCRRLYLGPVIVYKYHLKCMLWKSLLFIEWVVIHNIILADQIHSVIQ